MECESFYKYKQFSEEKLTKTNNEKKGKITIQKYL